MIVPPRNGFQRAAGRTRHDRALPPGALEAQTECIQGGTHALFTTPAWLPLWLHAAQSYFHDVCPAYELGIPVVWVNRNAEEPTAEARPTGEVKTLLGLVEWLEKQ